MIYLIRYLFIFVVFAFVAFFFWKTLLTTSYFHNRRRLRKILVNVLIGVISIVTTVMVLSIFMEFVK